MNPDRVITDGTIISTAKFFAGGYIDSNGDYRPRPLVPQSQGSRSTDFGGPVHRKPRQSNPLHYPMHESTISAVERLNSDFERYIFEGPFGGEFHLLLPQSFRPVVGSILDVNGEDLVGKVVRAYYEGRSTLPDINEAIEKGQSFWDLASGLLTDVKDNPTDHYSLQAFTRNR